MKIYQLSGDLSRFYIEPQSARIFSIRESCGRTRTSVRCRFNSLIPRLESIRPVFYTLLRKENRPANITPREALGRIDYTAKPIYINKSDIFETEDQTKFWKNQKKIKAWFESQVDQDKILRIWDDDFYYISSDQGEIFEADYMVKRIAMFQNGNQRIAKFYICGQRKTIPLSMLYDIAVSDKWESSAAFAAEHSADKIIKNLSKENSAKVNLGSPILNEKNTVYRFALGILLQAMRDYKEAKEQKQEGKMRSIERYFDSELCCETVCFTKNELIKMSCACDFDHYRLVDRTFSEKLC